MMNVLFLSRSGSGNPHAFVAEQANALMRNFSCTVEHLLITKGGVSGFLDAAKRLHKHLRTNKVHIVHVHYGLWTMIAVINNWLLPRKVKIVVTYHGSDIFKSKERPFALVGSWFAAQNILVTDRMARFFSKRYSIIPCGIDTDIKTGYRNFEREKNGWGNNDFVVLFSSSFNRDVKDPVFASEVIKAFKNISERTIHFIELKGYSRQELTALMQGADCLLMCSKSEGSPQVIKEAILNSLPVVSNNVGDVAAICDGVDNTFIIEKSVEHFVRTLVLVSNRRSRIVNTASLRLRFDNNLIAGKIHSVYVSTLKGGRFLLNPFSVSSALSVEKQN